MCKVMIHFRWRRISFPLKIATLIEMLRSMSVFSLFCAKAILPICVCIAFFFLFQGKKPELFQFYENLNILTYFVSSMNCSVIYKKNECAQYDHMIYTVVNLKENIWYMQKRVKIDETK